ncbi:MAG: hypothetical protein ACI8UO_000014 [Verrucomicrobiales bacterium]|jgi:hypothetical protein
MEITKRWLNKIAGWKAVKQAGVICAAGSVVEAEQNGELIKGLVISGGKRLAAGLRINGPIDIDNLCTCRVSRNSGQICEHSVAVALSLIDVEPEPQFPKRSAPGKRAVPAAAAAPPAPAPSDPVQVRFDKRAFELWAQGRIPIRFEVRDGEPNNADLRIQAWLGSVGIEKLPAQATLKPALAAQLIVLLRGASQVSVEDEELIVADLPAGRLRVELSRNGGEFTLKPFPWSEDDQQLLDGFAWFPERRLIQSLRKPPKGAESVYADLLAGKAARLDATELIRAAETWEDAVEFVGETLQVARAKPSFHLALEGSLNALTGVATVRYPEGIQFRMGKADDSDFPIESEGRYLNRNIAAENQAALLLVDAGLKGPDSSGQFQLRGKAEIASFVASKLPDVRLKWEVELGERIRHVLRNIEVIRPKFESAGTDNNWLSFSINYTSDRGNSISRAEIQKLLAKGQNQTRLSNGREAIVDLSACEEVSEVLFDVNPQQDGEFFRAKPHHAGYLASALGGEVEFDEKSVDLNQLGELKTILRDYQSDGIQWLTSRLLGGSTACLLADEMGLGKTLQSLAAAELLLQKAGGGQVLVVCPTSLLNNWANEAAKFLPERSVYILHGPNRWNNVEDFEYAEIVITSYALMTRDLEKLVDYEFNCVILDEASAIKNPDTQNSKSARQLVAGARVALTGTPVENTIRELWSIFEFLTPGYLGTRQEFKERYEAPIASGAKPAPILKRLRQRVEPFFLRRLKTDVAKDLPPKIEQIRFCELSGGQAELYESILRESRKKIDDALSTKNEGKARMTMLTALLRLRQVCCDPRLLKLENGPTESGKLDAFSELLEEALEGGHKVLVFSQFVGMLHLLREQLLKAGQEFCYLDGSSSDRAAQVERFQTDSAVSVFLISLKAGGYGLNLTAADTVIHYDPWWNPAVEAQATDRAHRIGQDRPVTSYKLITSGAVEERILALQRKKRAVIEAALDDGEPMMQGLSVDEIRDVIG